MSVEELVGIAVGQIGMSLSELYGLDAEEFGAIYKSYAEREEGRYRAGWEQARFVSLNILSPYTKKKLKPTDIALFPWEKEQQRAERKRVSDRDIERIKRQFGIIDSTTHGG